MAELVGAHGGNPERSTSNGDTEARATDRSSPRSSHQPSAVPRWPDPPRQPAARTVVAYLPRRLADARAGSLMATYSSGELSSTSRYSSGGDPEVRDHLGPSSLRSVASSLLICGNLPASQTLGTDLAQVHPTRVLTRPCHRIRPIVEASNRCREDTWRSRPASWCSQYRR